MSLFKIFTSKNARKQCPATARKSPATDMKSSVSKRLWREWRAKDDILNALVSTWLLWPENVFRWEATITGPANCPFEHGVFVVSVEIPTKFPYKPPQFKFKTKIFHPNINEKGEINIDVLGSNWSPVWKIKLVLLSICSVLSDPVEPFIASNPAVKLYKEDREAYDKIAREWTVKYAKA